MSYGRVMLTLGSYKVLAGAAAFAAMRKYEQHLRDTGKPVNHGTMKASTLIISFSYNSLYLRFRNWYAIMHATYVLPILYMATLIGTLGVPFGRSCS